MAGDVAGGIAGVVALLTEHGDAIEADLARVYGVHVGDFPTRLTARRLRVLVTNLGPDACYWQSVRRVERERARPDPEVVTRALAAQGITIPDELRR